MYQYLKTNEAAANYSGAMESGNHFKNWTDSKSQTSRGHFLTNTFNRKFILALITAVLTTGYTQAQATFGARAGVNFSTMSIYNKETKKIVPTSFIPGFQIGALAEIFLKEENGKKYKSDVFFQPGLFISSQGYKISIMKVEETVSITYLQIPANFAVKVDLSKMTLVLNAGPYLGYAVGGKNIFKAGGDKTESDIKFGSGEDADMKGFDLGYVAGIGLQFGNFQAGLGGPVGLLSLSNDKDIKQKNLGISFTATYFFGK